MCGRVVHHGSEVVACGVSHNRPAVVVAVPEAVEVVDVDVATRSEARGSPSKTLFLKLKRLSLSLSLYYG